jgi:hypothetical protein
MSPYMSRLMSRRFQYLSHGSFSFSHSWCALSGSSDDDHVSSEDRITLYPAAPFRLATMLRAWIISCWWDGANLLDGVCAKETLSHTSDPSTRPALEALSSF